METLSHHKSEQQEQEQEEEEEHETVKTKKAPLREGPNYEIDHLSPSLIRLMPFHYLLSLYVLY